MRVRELMSSRVKRMVTGEVMSYSQSVSAALLQLSEVSSQSIYAVEYFVIKLKVS